MKTDGNAFSQVRVVSFDLDNTLWKTGPTIQAANDALAAYLEEKDIVQPERVEKIMGNLFQLSKATYSPLSGDDPKSPVKLTQLRKDSLRFVLEENNGYSEEDAIAEAERAFEVWTTARHEALPHFFADSVIETLERIRAIVSSDGQPVLLGAITDGNSDPRTVPELARFFDFVVNAESVGISKPDRRVYMAAIKEVSVHPYVKDIFSDDGALIDNEDMLEETIGPWWIHIGDDFLKDIVAAKDMRMKTVWAKELVLDKTDLTAEASKAPKKSLEDFVKEVSEKLADKNVLEMVVGAEDYLAESLESEFADATVTTFVGVADTILAWHERGASSTTAPATKDTQSAPPPPVAQISDEKASSEQATAPISESSSKFCMACGAKLPITAKFCSSCGEKQGEVA